MKYIKVLNLFVTIVILFTHVNVLAAASITPSVYQLKYQGDKVLNAKEEYNPKLKLNAKNVNEIGYNRVSLKVNVLEGDKSKVRIYLKENNKEYDLLNKVSKEFSLSSNYKLEHNLRIVYQEEGNYRLSFQLMDINNNKIIAKDEVNMSVMESLTTFKEQNQTQKTNKLIPIFIIMLVLFFGLYIYLKDRIVF